MGVPSSTDDRSAPLPSRMRAAVIVAPARVALHEVDVPRPKPDEVLLRLDGCGLCGSNLPAWEGRPWFHYPMAAGAPGHEAWGTIVAVGSAASHLRVGQRATGLTFKAFAEYDVAPADAVVPLPPQLASSEVPGEPLGCAMNVVARSGVVPGITCAVVGVGFMGALLTQILARRGVRVVAISRRAYALEVARRMGAELALPLGEDWREAEQSILQALGSEGFDRVFECTGLEKPLSLAARLTRTRGRLVIVGYHQDGPRQIDLQLWNWRGLDVINAHERERPVYARGIAAAVDALSSKRLAPAPLFTHRLPLERLDEAFQLAHERPDGFLKALVLTGNAEESGQRSQLEALG